MTWISAAGKSKLRGIPVGLPERDRSMRFNLARFTSKVFAVTIDASEIGCETGGGGARWWEKKEEKKLLKS
jgi:hypothetical protein